MKNQNIYPKISVIIVSYNSRKYLSKCIKSIFKQKIPLEIIIVDNNSTDNSVKHIKKYFRSIKLITNNKNLGFGQAVNQAVKHAKGKYILSINADMILGNNYLVRLISIIKNDSHIGAIQGKICNYPNNKKIISTGLCFNYWGILISNYKTNNNTQNDYVFSVEVPLVKKTLFKKINGYDPHYFLYYEDIDFCWKIWLLGYKVYLDKNSVIYHKTGGSINKKNKYDLYQETFYNSFYTYIKNYQFINIIKCIILRMFITIISSIIYLRNRKFILIKIQIIGWLKMLTNISKINKERKKIQACRKVSDKIIWQSVGKSINLQYIIKILKNSY